MVCFELNFSISDMAAQRLIQMKAGTIAHASQCGSPVKRNELTNHHGCSTTRTNWYQAERDLLRRRLGTTDRAPMALCQEIRRDLEGGRHAEEVHLGVASHVKAVIHDIELEAREVVPEQSARCE